MPHISDAKLTSNRELRDHFDLMCLEGTYSLTEETATPGATSFQVGVTNLHNISLMGRIIIIFKWRNWYYHRITMTHIYIYIYIYIYIRTGSLDRVFPNGPGDLGSIPGRVIPKTRKMVLDTALLNTQQYIKGKVKQSRERSSALPYISV